MNPTAHWIQRTAAWVLLCVIVAGGLKLAMSAVQEALIFYPETLADAYVFRFDVPFEEIRLEPEPGVLLHALHFRPPSPRGLLLYFHGNAGSLRGDGQEPARPAPGADPPAPHPK